MKVQGKAMNSPHEIKYSPHKIKWTKEKIHRFWEYFSSNNSDNEYFTNKSGNAILNFVAKYLTQKGEILDFGCGKGFLIEKLLTRNIVCSGIDTSSNSANKVNNKFSKFTFNCQYS